MPRLCTSSLQLFVAITEQRDGGHISRLATDLMAKEGMVSCWLGCCKGMLARVPCTALLCIALGHDLPAMTCHARPPTHPPTLLGPAAPPPTPPNSSPRSRPRPTPPQLGTHEHHGFRAKTELVAVEHLLSGRLALPGRGAIPLACIARELLMWLHLTDQASGE